MLHPESLLDGLFQEFILGRCHVFNFTNCPLNRKLKKRHGPPTRCIRRSFISQLAPMENQGHHFDNDIPKDCPGQTPLNFENGTEMVTPCAFGPLRLGVSIVQRQVKSCRKEI